MEIKKVLYILEQLPYDVGLFDEDNWDDRDDTQEWRRNAIKALEIAAASMIETDEIVGFLELNGQHYKVIN